MADWNWHGEDEKSSTVVKPVSAIAVYRNVNDEIVIRQQSPLGDEDAIVVVPPEHANALIAGIEAALQSE